MPDLTTSFSSTSLRLNPKQTIAGNRQSLFQSVGRCRHFAAISQQHERFAGKQIGLVACRVNIEIGSALVSSPAWHDSSWQADTFACRNIQRTYGPQISGPAQWCNGREYRQDLSPTYVLRCDGEADWSCYRRLIKKTPTRKRDHLPLNGRWFSNAAARRYNGRNKLARSHEFKIFLTAD